MSSPAQAPPESAAVLMRSIIQRIATGPELSKDISRREAEAGMRLILEGQADPVQAAIFLIALRMKRETDEENLGILDAVRAATETVTAPVDEVVDVADPYDGYNRTVPASPFLPALLAACGVPAVSHGVERMGPKYGLTNRQVLRAAGIRVDLSPREAAERLGDPAVGWAYVDQSAFAPKLHQLASLRSQIVKRPALTTVEVLAGPVRGREKTHLVTGYVHKPYPRLYAVLAREAGFDSLLLVRGVEGGVVPSLRQAGKICFYHDRGEERYLDTDPKALGIEQDVRAASLPADLPKADEDRGEIGLEVDIDAFAAYCAEEGLAALEGKAGAIRDGLIYAGALTLFHLKRCESLRAAADAVRKVLDDGSARRRVGV